MTGPSPYDILSQPTALPICHKELPPMPLATPDTFSPVFDLPAELSTYRRGESESIKLYGVPSYLSASLKRLVHIQNKRVEFSADVSQSAVISLCISAGLSTILAHGRVVELGQLEGRIHDVTFTDEKLYEDVLQMMARYPITLPSSSAGNRTNIGVGIPVGLKRRLDQAAGHMGSSLSAVGLFSLVVILSAENGPYAAHVKQMNFAIAEFFASVSRRLSMGEKLLELADD